MTKPIDILTGGQHSRDIANAVCTFCGGEASRFADPLSEREHRISGLCQICQDSVFAAAVEDE